MHLFDIKIPSERQKKAIYQEMIDKVYSNTILAEFVEHSPIIIQNSSNSSGWKNLDVRPYDHMTIQGATFNMHGQLYHGHTNVMALFSSPVVSALGSELDNLGSSPGWGKALCLWDVQEKKKMQVLLLGLAKSIYYHNMLLDQPQHKFLFTKTEAIKSVL